MASLQKNVASQNFTFCLVLASSGAALVGGTASGFVTKDAGAQAAMSGSFTGQGNGQYNYAPTQGETNATDVGFLITATGAIPVNIDFHTDQVDAQGLLKVDTEDWKGTAVASPATGGIPDVNEKNINNVSTSTVTTVNANIGTTQPVNYTGTAGSALVKSDVIDFNSSAAGSLPTNFSALSITAAGLVATTSNIKKNTASAGFTFLMTDATTHTAKTGLTVTSQVSIDKAGFVPTVNSVVEVANGTYGLDLAAADVNGNHIMLMFTASGADQLNVEIITQP
jgi:hypothetical protein